jgi:hypothetical protein
MKCLYTFLAATALSSALFAQTPLSAVNGINWRLLPTWQSTGLLDVSTYNSAGSPLTEGISTGVLKMDNGSFIATVNGRDGSELIKLNKDLTTQWLNDIGGIPLAIGMFNGKILIITTTDFSYWKGPANHYAGVLADPKTGQILTKKELFAGDEDYYQQPVFLIAPDGSSFKMAVRKSSFTRGAHNPFISDSKVADGYYNTTSFSLIEFDKDLNTKSTVTPKLEDGYFMGGTTNKNGDVFFMTDVSQGFIRIARYLPGQTTPVKTIQQSVDINDDVIKNLKNFYLFTSKDDPLVIFLAGTFENANKDYELVVGKFNFKDGTVKSSSQVMDKDYVKGIEKSYVPFSKKFNSLDLGPLKELKIKNVLEDNGRLIVALSSFSTRSSNNTLGNSTVTSETVIGYDLLVDIFDNQVNMQYQQVIPRSYSTKQAARLGIGMHVKDNVLYLIANNNKGLLGFKALYSQIDLKTGAITNIAGIEKGDISKLFGIDPYATFWFDDKFALSYMEDKEWYHNSEDAHLQLLSY